MTRSRRGDEEEDDLVLSTIIDRLERWEYLVHLSYAYSSPFSRAVLATALDFSLTAETVLGVMHGFDELPCDTIAVVVALTGRGGADRGADYLRGYALGQAVRDYLDLD